MGPVGPAGPAGTAGIDGAEGAAGPQGPAGDDAPAPTQEQVDAAIERFCAANDDCMGPTGPAGETGETGRGIAGIECEGGGPLFELEITITYTDATEEIVSCD